MNNQNQLMIDFETFSTKPNGYIIQIGIKVFNFDLEDDSDYGLNICPVHDHNNYHFEPRTFIHTLDPNDRIEKETSNLAHNALEDCHLEINHIKNIYNLKKIRSDMRM